MKPGILHVITESKFVDLIHEKGWTHRVVVDKLDSQWVTVTKQHPETEEDVEVFVRRIYVTASVRSVYQGMYCYSIDIRYSEKASFLEGEPGNLDYTAGDTAGLRIDGIKVIDDDGEELCDSEILDILPREFTNIDFDEIERFFNMVTGL